MIVREDPLLQQENRVASKLALESKLACNTGGGPSCYLDCGAGYCVFNDVVVRQLFKNKEYAKRVLIIDLDVHQGMGIRNI